MSQRMAQLKAENEKLQKQVDSAAAEHAKEIEEITDQLGTFEAKCAQANFEKQRLKTTIESQEGFEKLK